MSQQEKVYILGHKNPDTDSICSAIAYADIHNRTSKDDRFEPRRAGQINEETEYVLKRFGFAQPGYMPNVGTQVKDMEIFVTPHLETSMSLKHAWDLMKANGWKGADTWAENANSIAPTIVGGSKKHGGPDLGPVRARKAWAQLGVDGLGVANEAPAESFEGMPRLTPRMIARIQGFPDTWDFGSKKTAACRMIGNAFPPPVAKAVGFQIRKVLEENDSVDCRSAKKVS